ncbi:type VI secretion system contractile sheath small subunit [Robbsia sp. KACC 23696]|uniref:type VI secretion system contractile sheath small subunit n=1 Tax=Robbsia sp. KACC 23696 TaxID=3149231 RepID=UPI00325BC2D3
MSNSLQKWVGRNRSPRVQITYDVEVGDAVERRELPMVVGVLSDLSGMPEKPLPKLKDRRLTEIDRDNFNDVMGRMAPRLVLSTPDTMKGEGNLELALRFDTMHDFHPDALVNQVPRLKRLLEARQQLRDLLAKLDGNDELDALLEGVVSNTEALKALQHDAGTAGATPETARDADQSTRAIP